MPAAYDRLIALGSLALSSADYARIAKARMARIAQTAS